MRVLTMILAACLCCAGCKKKETIMSGQSQNTEKHGTERRVSVQGMSVVCPPGWQDSSMLIITRTTGFQASLIINRGHLPEGLTGDRVQKLQGFADQQIANAKTSLTDFHEISQRKATSERMTAEIKFTSNSDGFVTIQSVTVAYARPGQDDILISTITAAQDEFPEVEPQFREILRSFKTD